MASQKLRPYIVGAFVLGKYLIMGMAIGVVLVFWLSPN